MNPSTERALERALRALARPPRVRRPGISRAPLILALGLILAYHLLVRLVPRVWATTLPGGLDQARHFRGPPALVFKLARTCTADFPAVVAFISIATLLALLLTRLGLPFRLLAWCAALAAILLNAALVWIVLRTAVTAASAEAGLPL